MADIVQQRLEEMLPEMVDLEKRGIFSKGELQTVMKSRRKFEYSTNSRSCSKDDFLNYIKHEIALETLRRKRANKNKANKEKLADDLTGVSSFSIIRRIHFLFSKLLIKYADDLSMWLEYVKFCLDSGSTKSFNKAIMKALRFHPREALLWTIAAERQAKLGNVSSARNMLFRGLRMKPYSTLSIWKSLLNVELLVACKCIEHFSAVETVWRKSLSELIVDEDRVDLTMHVYNRLSQDQECLEEDIVAGFILKLKDYVVSVRGEGFMSKNIGLTDVLFVEDVLE